MTDFGALASPRTLPGASIHNMPATALGSGSLILSATAAAGGCSSGPMHQAANGSSHTAAAAGTASDGPTDMVVAEQEQHHQQQPMSPLAALAEAATSPQAQQLLQQPHPQQHYVHKPPLVPASFNRRGGLVLQGLQSPLPVMHLGPPGPATPISQAMGSVSWLRSLAQGMPLEPSPALQRYMAAAGADAGTVLVERVKGAAEAVFMSGAGGDPLAVGGLQGLQHGLAQERQGEVRLGWCWCFGGARVQLDGGSYSLVAVSFKLPKSHAQC
jgi:hypothetical protein